MKPTKARMCEDPKSRISWVSPDGQTHKVNAVSGNDLEEAKKFYSMFKYIGSGTSLTINGKETQFTKTHHFFK